MAELTIAELTEEDIEELAQLEELCFAVPWSKDSLYQELENSLAFYLVVHEAEQVIGYIGCWLICDEAHITNLAIHPAYQARGIGTGLMQYFLEVLKVRGIRAVTLEVRVSNLRARRLYEKMNFIVRGTRKGYYADNGEDALIMWLERLEKE